MEYNFKEISENIARAAQKVGKNPNDITFLAATKTVDVATINHAISLGLKYIGENRVQELLSKYDFLAENATFTNPETHKHEQHQPETRGGNAPFS